jgi:hypothetical protein
VLPHGDHVTSHTGDDLSRRDGDQRRACPHDRTVAILNTDRKRAVTQIIAVE